MRVPVSDDSYPKTSKYHSRDTYAFNQFPLEFIEYVPDVFYVLLVHIFGVSLKCSWQHGVQVKEQNIVHDIAPVRALQVKEHAGC